MIPPLGSIGPDATVERDVVYTPAGWPKALKADVYRPKAAGPSPAVLLIHGSGMRNGGSRSLMNPIAARLVRRGYVVVNATYRFIPDDTYPAPLEDLREALKWMRDHAATHGIDPERIATFGYSAGGYLAALVALDDGAAQEHVRAIVAGGAPFDLTFYPGGDLIPAYLGGTQAEVPEKFWEASPVNFVLPNSPPIFMYQGTRDRLVKPEHALRMKSVYEREGVYYKLRWLEGNGHVAAFVFSRPIVDEAINFLDREMK